MSKSVRLKSDAVDFNIPQKQREAPTMLRPATMAVLVLLTGLGSIHGSDPVGPAPRISQPEVLPYEVAYRKAKDERKPLLILVGADWCPACKTLKNETIAPMRESGALKEVIYTQLDKDANPELANEVMQGKILPQLVVFCQSDTGWKRFSLTGMQTESRVKELIRKASEVLPVRR
jgi:thiol:disulfide interchange protein